MSAFPHFPIFVLGGFAVLAMLPVLAFAPRLAGEEHPSFKKDVFPILRENCLRCHRPGGEGYEKSGLDLRTYEGLMKGTRFGSVVDPGNAFLSNLNVLIEGRASPKIRMPYHEKELSRWQKVIIRRWVNRGAKNN